MQHLQQRLEQAEVQVKAERDKVTEMLGKASPGPG